MRAPDIVVTPVSPDALRPLREAYRRELACQIIKDAWHARGFTTPWLLHLDGAVAGYGTTGGSRGEPHDTLMEFYLVPAARVEGRRLFAALLAASRPAWIEAQTNDPFLHPRVYDTGQAWTAPTILFSDQHTTRLPAPGVTLRRLTEADQAAAFPHTTEPVGEWGLEREGRIVATGGLFYHYNPPYGDLYMEVEPACRGRGYASWLLQELKRICREGGRVPAARCDAGNAASRGALERAGMWPCGRVLRSRI